MRSLSCIISIPMKPQAATITRNAKYLHLGQASLELRRPVAVPDALVDTRSAWIHKPIFPTMSVQLRKAEVAKKGVYWGSIARE